MDALDRVGRRAGDRLAGLDVAGDRDHPDRRVLDEPLPDRDAVAGHDLQHARRDDLLRELDEAQQRERRLLGRLQDLEVARRERRPHLPDGHHQRVVPRADAGDDADRLAPDHRRVALDVLAGRLALEVARRAGEEAEVVGRERHLVARGHERLADVDRLELRELVGVLLDHVGERVEELGALLRRLLEPLRRRGLRGLDGAVDVLSAAARHLGDRLAGRRRDHLHRLARGRVGELAADQDLVLRGRGAHDASDSSALLEQIESPFELLVRRGQRRQQPDHVPVEAAREQEQTPGERGRGRRLGRVGSRLA